jgi:hypothetical protein
MGFSDKSNDGKTKRSAAGRPNGVLILTWTKWLPLQASGGDNASLD